jgi:SecD/SecF fusion protein
MRSIIRSALIVTGVLLLMGWAIFPAKDNLRLGKDLRGGVSLLYSVQNRESSLESAKDVINRTIEVLKNRVDPNGLFEISMVGQGTDRIEVQMPLPSPEVLQLKREFESELEGIAKAALSKGRIDVAVAAGPERARNIESLAHGNSKRKELLDAAAAAADAATAARTQYTAETDAAKKEALAQTVATAELAYEDVVTKVLATAISADELRRVVSLSPLPRKFVDRSGKPVSLMSPREEAEKKLRELHPDSLTEIDAVIGKYNAYAAQRKGLDDPEDLKRMLRGAGVLSFRIGVNPGAHPAEAELRRKFKELGPRNANADDARWCRLNRIDGWLHSKDVAEMLAADDSKAAPYFNDMGYVVEARSGDYYMLFWDTPGTRLTLSDHRDNPWAVSSASQGRDETGKLEIRFGMDPVGSRYLGELTSKHIGKKMGVLLDEEVYTAPNLQSAISASGRITGDFTAAEVDYVVRTLTGGSLQAALSPDPISEDTIAPQLGADNLRMGLWSGVYAAIVVAVFMLFYYFTCGMIAFISLLVSAVIILGSMALSKAAFTMPGIAGVILTFGMAVDSNVLIYERMREELLRGCDLKTAIRLGFDKAFSSIVDGNMTNLIVCVVLYYMGTPEIRGFAITMGIGVVATLFSSLVVSRLLFDIGVALGWRKTSMLPMAIPGLQAAITPNIKWLNYRYVFFTISGIYVGLGLAMIFFIQGPRMLDNQFLGGTKLTLQLKTNADGSQLEMTRKEIEERVKAIAATPDLPGVMMPLRNAEIIPLNPRSDGVTAEKFDIKVGPVGEGVVADPNAIPEAIKTAFADIMDVKPELKFTGSEQVDANRAPVYPIERPILGDNIDRAAAKDPVQAFIGGAAIVLENIEPASSLDSLKSRLDVVRRSSDYSSTLTRPREILVIGGTPDRVTSAVIVVRDENISVIEDEAGWTDAVKAKEWALVREALTKSTNLAGIQNFSPAVADTFQKQALAATLLSFFFIGIYIWVRFKTFSYSIAAVVALIHDVITVTGLLALCGWAYDMGWGDTVRQAGILPFKIDLNIVAALLTIAGYSLNDTVIIMDRIRENRGKLPFATSTIINDSINQTFSRTLITGGTTLVSCTILYFAGGEGMRAFAFCLTTGLIFGTYSSVAVAAPIVWSRKHDNDPGVQDREQPNTL